MKRSIVIFLSCLCLLACDKEAPPEVTAELKEAVEETKLPESKKTATLAQAAVKEKKAGDSPAIGSMAPDFTLKTHDGKDLTLSSLRGKIVVLEWTNPQCPFVVRHYNAKTMKTLAEKFGKEIEWLAIDSSHFVNAKDASAWRSKEELPYRVLLDADGATGKKFGARTTPHMYVIDAEGKVAYTGAIDNDPRGQEKTPVNHVGNAVEALLKGETPPVTQTTPYGCSVKYKQS